MVKNLREMINKTIQVNQTISEQTNGWYDIDEKLKILKSYIHILDNDKKDHDLAKTYFIILHNFLIIERMFYEDVVKSNKEINKNLDLERLKSVDDVLKKFMELYDNYHIIRNNAETFDSIESISLFLKDRPTIFQKLMKK